jgi:uncharacterized phiE125 gp8 family phage protein
MDTIVFGTPQHPTASITPYRSVVRITHPTLEPVSLSLAKSHLRVDTDNDNEYIQSLISVARQYVEDTLDITLCTTVWEASYDLFPIWAIVLPRAPLATGTITVTYRLGTGISSTLSGASNDFQVDSRVIPGRIYPNWATSWPATRGDENSVVVRYTAGYGAGPENVPPAAKQAILFLVASMYENRQPAVPGSVSAVPYTFDALLSNASLGVNYR